ncbi:hypothetical protein BOO29_16665 [Vibrio navarrensis]|nr:hypothetical protein [Vibrio navarrensis]
MATLTPKLASQIANIPYEIYHGENLKILSGEFKKHFSFSEDSTFKGRVGHWLRHNPFPATPLQFRA